MPDHTIHAERRSCDRTCAMITHLTEARKIREFCFYGLVFRCLGLRWGELFFCVAVSFGVPPRAACAFIVLHLL